MNIFYKCRCMEKEVEIFVPDRRPNGDLIAWTDMITHCISVDHKALKPLCILMTMQYMKIPFDEQTSPSLGVPPTKN